MSRTVVCLFELSGLSARDWAMAGWRVRNYDIAHHMRTLEQVGEGTVENVPWDAKDGLADIIRENEGLCDMVMCFAPCDDIASSGSMHFEEKLAKDPLCQKRAVSRLRMGPALARALGTRWVAENPVGRAATLWRNPNVYVDPYEFGGYLPEDDVHPMFPSFIAPRDAYTKCTGLWWGGGFVMPEKKPVPVDRGYSIQYRKLGGGNMKTAQIRSASPRGLMRAIFEANAGLEA